MATTVGEQSSWTSASVSGVDGFRFPIASKALAIKIDE